MGLLFAIAACCCLVLVGAAVALWWSIQRDRLTDEPAPLPFAVAMQRARSVPHPRMDLAAGIAAGTTGTQQVRGAARRRGLVLDAEAETAGLEDTSEQRSVPRPQRKDWAFYKEGMGDLSDPDPRRAPAGGVRRPLGTVSLPESR